MANPVHASRVAPSAQTLPAAEVVGQAGADRISVLISETNVLRLQSIPLSAVVAQYRSPPPSIKDI